MLSSRSMSSFQKLAVLLLLVLVLGACRAGWHANQPVQAKGPTFEQSFEAVQVAMRERSYLIEHADKSTGSLRTAQRTNRTWWWVIDAQVAQDGTVTFTASGSEEVQQGDEVRSQLIRYVDALKRSFEREVARKQTIQQ